MFAVAERWQDGVDYLLDEAQVQCAIKSTCPLADGSRMEVPVLHLAITCYLAARDHPSAYILAKIRRHW